MIDPFSAGTTFNLSRIPLKDPNVQHFLRTRSYRKAGSLAGRRMKTLKNSLDQMPPTAKERMIVVRTMKSRLVGWDSPYDDRSR